MMSLLIQYLKFLYKSNNQYGVHSPFVYHLVTKCFYKKIDHNLWNSFLKIKQQLLNNTNVIKVTDFGSGSKVFKTNDRKVSKIAKVAGISTKKANILIKIITYFKPLQILEIGTSLGLATSAIKTGNCDARITTLEGCSETCKIAKNLFHKNNFNHIDVISGNFNQTLLKATINKQFDFIYFDGNHTKKSTLHYFKTCLSTIQNNTIWVFDDIYWSKEMKQTWQEIKNHPKVSVTVDVFYFGIVFFRKEQAKEHFKIRVL